MLAAGSLLAGCYSTGDGVSPPGERIYFPVGLALTSGAKHLAVVSSDFDLQFNAGTLATLNVGALTELVAKPCERDSDCGGELHCDVTGEPASGEGPSYVCVGEDNDPCPRVGQRSEADRLLFPGRCEYLDPTKYQDSGGNPFLTDHVLIGAFATDATFDPVSTGDVAGRLFVPVRGDATLHWMDIGTDGKIDCGQAQNGGACSDAHRAGDDPDRENTRELRLSPEPFGVAVDPQGTAVLVTNQTTGRVSLFENKDDAVNLVFEVTNLATRPMSAAALPTPKLATVTGEVYEPGFLVTFRNSPEVDLIRYYADDGSDTSRPYAARVNAVPITVNSVGSDSRGIAVEDSARLANEADCDKNHHATEAEYVLCLRTAAATPLDVFVASRAPSSLLVGRTTPAQNALQSTELPAFFDTVSLSQGPSRVVTGKVIVGRDRATDELQLEPRVFVSCFDSRRVFVYDPVRRRIDVEIATGRGPHALAVDEVHGWLFIGHFTDSFIGVVSLDARFAHTYGKTLATIGEPSAPRASK
jgi:hypothetical protein